MNRDEWPDGADWHRDYMAWDLPKSEDEAADAFKQAHGKPPEFVFATSDGILRAGPIPEDDDGLQGQP
jgi:hypothetical protein